MPKYLISWEEAVWYNLEIEAAFKEEALDKFHKGEYDRESLSRPSLGQEIIQDTIEIEEL